MIEFIILILFRALSGIQNGFGYAKKTPNVVFTTILMFVCFIVIGQSWGFPEIPIYRVALWALAFMLGGISIIGVGIAFADRTTRIFRDIHLWESFILPCTMMMMWCGGANIWFIILSVYPGLVLHKIAINLGSGLPPLSNITDDPTGKTYNIPSLGIKIPRLTMKTRIIIAAASLVIAVVLHILGIT